MKSYLKYLVYPFICCTIFSMCSSSDKSEVVIPEEPHSSDVTIYTTTTDLSRELTKSTVDFSVKENMSPTSIKLNPNEKYQVIDGFGAAITGSTCYNLMLMKSEDRSKFLNQTFSLSNGYGFSYVRISIGCSDFSLSEYTCCDTKGVENFALQSEENKYVIPILKEILAINPSLKVMGSPWTCPKWMKIKSLSDPVDFDSWIGGQLNPKYYNDYAEYFVKWIKAFQEKGINIYSITPQNEPLNRGNSASLYMSWEEERDFVKNALGPTLQKAGLSTKIYAFDHNYNYDNISDQMSYPVKIYADNDASKFLSGAAFHNYGGDKSELLRVHNAAPDKDLVFSETSIGEWNCGRDLKKRLMDDMEQVALGTVNNWCKGVLVWNLMLDNDRGPNREGGCQTCYGAVDINNSDYKTITRNSHYYIIAHLSCVVRPGAVRIGTNGFKSNGITYSAFENVDGTYALVLSNNSSDVKKITIDDGNHHFIYSVPAMSVVSYNWKK